MAETADAPSAFDQSQAPWKNPLESMGAPPSFDYSKALEAKKGVAEKELKTVSGIMGSSEAGMKKYEGMADKKFQQMESFDPDQLKAWNAPEEAKKYQDDPFKAFGSFAMVASIGLAAFTKTPFINTMNAIAGVVNGRREKNDQDYERAYKAWQDNNKVLLERFNVVKEQVSESLAMMKEKGEMGKVKLANALTKFGMEKDLALLNAGYDDMLMTKWSAQVKGMEGMAKASEEIERMHSVREAMKTEDTQRKELGMPAMTPQERLEMQSYLTKDHTPEQAAFQDAWHSFIREHPNATAEEKTQFMQQARSYGRFAQTKETGAAISALQQAVPDMTPTETAMIKASLDTKGARAPAVIAKMTEAMDLIKAAADSGNPMNPGQRAELLRKAAGSGGGMQDQAGLDLAAENYLQSGKLPSRNKESNEPIIARAAKMADERKIPLNELPKRWQEFNSQQVAIQRFLSGPQGQQTVSINTVIDHLQTMREVGQALKNGDITLLNRIGQAFARETGQPEPTNALMTAQMVGSEIVKAMGVAGAGTESERSELGNAWNLSSSPEQIEGAARTAEKLLAGKVFSLRLAFPGATGLDESKYDRMLSNQTKKVLFPLIRSDKPDEVKAPEASAGDTPPASILKEGVVTTFKNGTSWILKDGKPVKVK